jgi:hypothetical protein
MKQYLQVNWVNGMKITSGHFIEMENHFIDRIQHTVSGCINDLSYGLLPVREKETNVPSFLLSLGSNKIKVLQDLSLITPSGNLIQLLSNMEVDILKPASESETYFLVVSVSPFERTPYGEINENETPLRYPHSIPEYHFELLPLHQNLNHVFGEDIVPLAKYNGSFFEEDTSYIPPCTSIQAHPALIEIYNTAMKTMAELEKVVPELLKKQNITNRMLLIDLTHFLDQNKAAMDWYLPYMPPVFLLEKINQVARIIRSSVEIQKIQIKDELKSLLQEIIAFNYDHLDIAKSVKMIKSFTENYVKLLPRDENVFGV